MTTNDQDLPGVGDPVRGKGRNGLLRIGQVAEIVGLSLRTVRFYEEEGLVVPVARTEGGFRLYDEDCIERFRLIMQMKPLGFSVEEMRSLIETRSALAGGVVDEITKSDLVERRRMFSELAEAKVRSLKEQLAIAEGFSSQLSREVMASTD